MNWFWLNIPLDAVFFLAMTLIPLWLVFKRPDRGPVPESGLPQVVPMTAHPDQRVPEATKAQNPTRVLVGAGR